MTSYKCQKQLKSS
uniref:Uncharacterized protein n=1 Tax=Anguilla anguilla TaxID=7936 RepID=A0A0E9RCL5_ANGAN